MIETSLDAINAEIQKIQPLTEGIGDTQIISASNEGKLKVVSDKLYFEEDNVYLYLTFNPNLKNVKCIFYVTEINSDFVETMITRVGLLATDVNIQNYSRDPTMVDKFWNDVFVKKYNELFKYLRRTKMKMIFQEKFPPAFNKNRENQIVDDFG